MHLAIGLTAARPLRSWHTVEQESTLPDADITCSFIHPHQYRTSSVATASHSDLSPVLSVPLTSGVWCVMARGAY